MNTINTSDGFKNKDMATKLKNMERYFQTANENYVRSCSYMEAALGLCREICAENNTVLVVEEPNEINPDD